MTDLVARLRTRATDFRSADNYLNEAADRIEQLESLLKEARGYITPTQDKYAPIFDRIDALLAAR